MAENLRPNGLFVVTDNPDVESAHLELDSPPVHACYVLGQFARSFAGIVAEKADPTNPFAPPGLTAEEYHKEVIAMNNEVMAACKRTCQTSCRLEDVMLADSSPLDVELDISDDDVSSLWTIIGYLELMRPVDDKPLSDGDQHVRGVLEPWLKMSLDAYEQQAQTEFVTPEVEDSCYQMLGLLTDNNFHVMKQLMGTLFKIALLQQAEGEQAAIAKFGISFAQTQKIGTAELIKLLVHPDRDFNFALNLKSTPRTEMLRGLRR